MFFFFVGFLTNCHLNWSERRGAKRLCDLCRGRRSSSGEKPWPRRSRAGGGEWGPAQAFPRPLPLAAAPPARARYGPSIDGAVVEGAAAASEALSLELRGDVSLSLPLSLSLSLSPSLSLSLSLSLSHTHTHTHTHTLTLSLSLSLSLFFLFTHEK